MRGPLTPPLLLGRGEGIKLIKKIRQLSPRRQPSCHHTTATELPPPPSAIVREEQMGGGIIRPSPWLQTPAATPQLGKKMPPLPVLLATASIEHDSSAKGTTSAQGGGGGEGPHAPHRQGHLLMRGPATPPLLLGRGEGLKLIKKYVNYRQGDNPPVTTPQRQNFPPPLPPSPHPLPPG